MSDASKRIAVVGLGTMGRPIARNLIAAGYEVTVWNRSPGPVAELVADGARAALDVADAFESGVVFSILAQDQAFTDTFLDEELLATLPAGSVHVNLATVSVDLVRRAARQYREHGIGYLAAPVFGRAPVAERGELAVLAAGDPDLIERVQPFFDVIGSRTWRLGDDPAQANIVKISGNYLIAAAIEALGEAVSLAERSGVDARTLVEVLTSTLFPGSVYSGYGTLIADRAYEPAGFSTVLGLKDVNLAVDAAAAADLRLPFGDVLREIFTDALAGGQGDLDWSSIAELQRQRTLGGGEAGPNR